MPGVADGCGCGIYNHCKAEKGIKLPQSEVSPCRGVGLPEILPASLMKQESGYSDATGLGA